MTYEEAVQQLFDQLPIFHRQGASAMKPGIQNIVDICSILGNPHVTPSCIHIAGTNGKGSVAHMLASVLQEAGYRVGLHTSPHIQDVRERFRVNGAWADEAFVVDFVQNVLPKLQDIQPSFFELLVAMSFVHFEQEEVDISIIETGMGGRLDATNVVTPLVSVITSIGLDHTQFLGDTLAAIAGEKAGIIKPQVPVVIGDLKSEAVEVIARHAQGNGSALHRAEADDRYTSDIQGGFQAINRGMVLEVLQQIQSKFPVQEEHIRLGFSNVKSNTGFAGRWETIQEHPKVIADVGHNEEALRMIAVQLEKEPYKTLHVVWSALADKDVAGLLQFLPKEAHYYWTQADVPRAMNRQELQSLGQQVGLRGEAYSSVQAGYEQALANASDRDLIFVGGSFFTVAGLPSPNSPKNLQ